MMDVKSRHGRFLVLYKCRPTTILLLSGATATNPQVLVESSSAKGSNQALSYEQLYHNPESLRDRKIIIGP